MNDDLRNAIDHLREGVQVIDFDWRYVYLNDAAAFHGRRSAAELIGRRMHDCYPGIEETHLFEVLERVMASRAPEALRNRFDYGDGTPRWFELRIHPIPSGICVMSMDVTGDHERQERLEMTEAQLRHAQKLEAIGRLAGGIAHDFNNQLTVIIGLAQFVMAADEIPESAQRDLREIAAAAERSAGLTQRLLALGRRQPFRLEPINLNDVVRRASRLLERTLGENIACEVRVDPAMDLILADAGQLEHVLTNLAVNARDAMPQGGRLIITTGCVDLSEAEAQEHPSMRSGRYAVLAVTDTGQGMDAETKARIFEPFFTTKPEGIGTGLGLSMVYALVKQMRGFIWVDSELNQGATFRLYFPVCPDVANGVERGGLEDAITEGHGETILVVEDDRAVRDFVVRALRGYAVTAVQTAEEALECLRDRRRRVDLLLVDIVLPGLSGPMLIERLQHTRVPVVFMSGYSELHWQNAALHERPTLRKPFTAAELVHAVQSAMLDGLRRNVRMDPASRRS